MKQTVLSFSSTPKSLSGCRFESSINGFNQLGLVDSGLRMPSSYIRPKPPVVRSKHADYEITPTIQCQNCWHERPLLDEICCNLLKDPIQFWFWQEHLQLCLKIDSRPRDPLEPPRRFPTRCLVFKIVTHTCPCLRERRRILHTHFDWVFTSTSCTLRANLNLQCCGLRRRGCDAYILGLVRNLVSAMMGQLWGWHLSFKSCCLEIWRITCRFAKRHKCFLNMVVVFARLKRLL